MPKLKVMHILNTNDYSGAEKVAIMIIENYGEEVEGIYVSLRGKIGDILRQKSITYYPVDRMNVITVKKAIRDIKPDIIHAHDFAVGCIVAGSFTKIPIINHLHNNAPWMKKICSNSLLYVMAALKYRRILTVSEAIMEEYIFGSILNNKTIIVDNPIDINEIKRLADKKVESAVDIAFLGRLAAPKDPHKFLRIVRDVKNVNPNIKAVMIGDGGLRGEIEDEIKALELEKTVKLLGFQCNPYSILASCKLLCMPSAWEGFGLAAAEALVLGKPVVCSGAGGLKKIVNSDCGKICISEKEYIQEIIRLLEDKDYYRRKEEGARYRAGQLNNLSEYMKKIEGVYKGILDGK